MWRIAATVVLVAAINAQTQDALLRLIKRPANHDEIKRRDEADNGVVICRLMFTSSRTEQGGGGWPTDYPLADKNLSIRLSELTTIHMAVRPNGEPIYWLVDLDEPIGLSRCPLLLLSDAGTAYFTVDEGLLLRDYVRRGGILWNDDYWGPAAWAQWDTVLHQILPEIQVRELEPSHPIYTIMHRFHEVPQISNISYWRGAQYGSGEDATRERGDRSPRGELHGGFDREGHLVAVMTYNTDIADTWEQEGAGEDYFHAFAALGYGFGINILLYAMSH